MLNSGSKHTLSTLDCPNQPSLWASRVPKRRSYTNEDSTGAVSGTQRVSTIQPRNTDNQYIEEEEPVEMDPASATEAPQAIMAVASQGSIVGVAIYDPLQGNLSCLQFTDDVPKGAKAHEQPCTLSAEGGGKLLQASSLHYQVLSFQGSFVVMINSHLQVCSKGDLA